MSLTDLLTHNVTFSYVKNISVVSGSIWTFFTDLPPIIWGERGLVLSKPLILWTLLILFFRAISKVPHVGRSIIFIHILQSWYFIAISTLKIVLTIYVEYCSYITCMYIFMIEFIVLNLVPHLCRLVLRDIWIAHW